MEFHNILHNLDIVINIYKLLNADDQFRLARVNSDLKEIFERYILPQANYNTLAVSGNLDYFVVTNETRRNRIAYKPEELGEFLNYHKEKVKNFIELNSIIFDIRPFKYLVELNYGFMKIPRTHLLLLAQLETISPKLELLDVDCCRDETMNDVMVGSNWSVDLLLPMKNLKSLKVNMPHMPYNWIPLSNEDFLKLCTLPKLEYLNLRCIVQPAKTIAKLTTANIKTAKSTHLKKLDIGFNIGRKANISPYLKIFENLVTLVATVRGDDITDLLLAKIADACINLEVFHIQNSYFANVQKFRIPPKVTELALYQSQGLTTENLTQILTELKLNKFSSKKIHYKGEIDDIVLSSDLRDLYIENYYNHFKLAFGGSLTLNSLSWRNESYTTIPNGSGEVFLRNCINLRELNLLTGTLSLSTLSHLKYLRKLTILPSAIPSSWSYIIGLLQHPSLNEIIMNEYIQAKNLREAQDIAPTNAVRTNSRLVKITREIFSLAMGFWLDLFDKNQELRLELYNFRGGTEFMRKLISHEKFPKYLKTLDICCFKISSKYDSIRYYICI